MAAHIITHDTFVDDILTGADTPDAAQARQSQVISLCAQGQFQLRKWASNSSVIIQSVPDSDRSMSTAVLFDDELEAGLKILGMRWNPKQDFFRIPSDVPMIKPQNAQFHLTLPACLILWDSFHLLHSSQST